MPSSSNKTLQSRLCKLIAYSRKPKTNPRAYPEEVIKLIIKICKRTNRSPEQIWFMLRNKYTIYISITSIYKVLKRKKLIKTRKYKRKQNKAYEAPKYLPREKVRVNVKYVRLTNELAVRLGKKYR